MKRSISNILRLILIFTFIFYITATLSACGEPSEIPEDATMVSIEKSSSHTKGHTVHPGGRIEYFITVKNDDGIDKRFTVKDGIPENTAYVSGADKNEDGTLSWAVTLSAGESKTLSYTIKVNDDTALCDGGFITPTKATVGEAEATTDGVYVERTLNSVDAKYIDIAIDALSASTFEDLTLAKWIYYVAFSQKAFDTSIFGGGFSATLDMITEGYGGAGLFDTIAPTLYGGKLITEAIDGAKGTPCNVVLESDLVVGDVIIARVGEDTSSYIYGSNGLFSIAKGCTAVDKNAVISTLTEKDAYAVIRPTTNLINFTHSDPDLVPEALTPIQEAIVETAKYYVLRGEWLQYDDTYYCNNNVSGIGNESRWEYALNAPEEYTSNNWGYINCAAFTHDVYWTVFGEKLPGNMYTTRNYQENSYSYGMRVFRFQRNVTDVHTEEEKAEVTSAFLSSLQPGDIMVIRRSTSSGHAMLYIGDGIFIHSTGSNYNYSGSYGVETYEPTIRFHRVNDYFLNPSSTNGYIFGEKVEDLIVVRPTMNSTWANYTVTEVSANRIKNLKGIIAEKLSSVPIAVSVNPGDTITYTIRIKNTNTHAVTLDVSDVVPANTVYVSGGDTVNGSNLSWSVTVPARETVDLTFTVKVADNAEDGAKILNDGAVIGGVPFKTYYTLVKNTLTKDEQESLINAYNAMKAEGNTLVGLEFVNELYKRAFGVEILFTSTDLSYVYEDYENGVFTAEGLPLLGNGKQAHKINDSGIYYDMLVDSLWGGRGVASGNQDNRRTQLAKGCNLVVGDIFIGRTSSKKIIMLYIGGDSFIDLSTAELVADSTDIDGRLERGPAYSYYSAVIRPSYGME